MLQTRRNLIMKWEKHLTKILRNQREASSLIWRLVCQPILRQPLQWMHQQNLYRNECLLLKRLGLEDTKKKYFLHTEGMKSFFGATLTMNMIFF